MLKFAKRCVLLYFRDKAAVFFSLMSAMIILALYLLFLGKVFTNQFSHLPGAQTLMYSWLFGGIIAMNSFTTNLGALGILVSDKQLGLNKDFISSPVKKSSIIAGYILNAVIVSVIMCLISMAISLVYLSFTGGVRYSLIHILSLIALIVYSSISSTSLVLLMILPLKSNNAYAAICSIAGTVIGFITGIYMPLNTMGKEVSTIATIFPQTHSAVLIRQILVEPQFAETFKNVPDLLSNSVRPFLGLNLQMGDLAITNTMSLMYIAISTVIFFGLSLLLVNKKSKG